MAGYRQQMPQRGPDVYSGKDTMNPRVQLEELQREMLELERQTAIQQALRALMGDVSEGYEGRWAGVTSPRRIDSDDISKENRMFDVREPEDMYEDDDDDDVPSS